ncbi:hypothetical protein BUALT_Bualt07G0173200 [Buddleja alternifolia]|uniref:Ionotropic glutamate receptor C-terminal domain-containing protein n=1 Tax=Buddleja alternifolia TaxID=168488 RepID=A0AAV6XM39_9LAMI|nr:hypothetical protein BUALT_Bualt07G0173200 [Buddleja alternifolia]
MKIQSFTFFLTLLFVSILCNAQNGVLVPNNNTFQVGVILDFDSGVGRIGLTSLSLALDDFYSINRNYSTRLVLHFRDSKGRVTDAAASALNLLKDVEVDAIIGPQKSSHANFVIGLGDTAKVPIISFSATSPSLHPLTPYFLQTAINDAAQVAAIAAIVNYFKWGQVTFVYEDTEYGNGIIPYLSNAFQEVNTRVSYRCVIPLSANDDFILRELYKMKTMQTRVFVVHISSALANRFFLKVKEAEMMSEGYVWIVNSGLMDLFYSMDSDVVEAMQGVLGVKPLVPRTPILRSTSLRWHEKFVKDNPGISQPEMSLFGVWAYDTLWALAMAAEKVGLKEPSSHQNVTAFNSTNMFVTEVSKTGPKLLEAMLDTTFEGLGGNFNMVNEQLEPSSFQILNVVGNGPREVGIWTPSRNSSEKDVSFSGKKLKSVIWPGESLNVPKGWEVPVSGGKLRIGVPAKAGFEEFVKVERDSQTNATKISGYFVDLFDSVMAALPYAVRYEYFAFETIDGSSAGSYNDLSYQVFIGNYHAAVGDITITANRSQYVDFTLPIEEGGVTRTQLIKYENPNDKWFFLKPLQKELWLAAIGLFVFTGVALWILEHRFNRAFRGPPSEHVGLILYIPFMSLVFANRERIVSNLARLVVVVWVFVVLILSSTYTASLSARLTAWKLQKAESEVKTLIDNGDYVGCREGSFIIEYLNEKGFNRNKIRTYKNPEDFDDALSKGSEKGGITALFSRTPYTNLFLSKYCNKYMKVGSPYHTEGFAFVFPKGSPLVADVSRAIIELTDNGRLSEIKDRWIRHSPCNEDEPNQSNASWKNIELSSFRILFGVTGGITATCLVVFLIRYLYNNRDFIQRNSESGATFWSKIRAMCRHFDQRDPKSFRSRAREDGGNASPDVNVYSARRSAVVPISPEETSPDSEEITASADESRSKELSAGELEENEEYVPDTMGADFSSSNGSSSSSNPSSNSSSPSSTPVKLKSLSDVYARDPKSFRSRAREDGGNASPDVNVYSARRSAVIPISPEETSPDSEEITASADESRSSGLLGRSVLLVSLAAVIEHFHWTQVVLIYEESDYGIIPHLSNSFQDVNARISYRSGIPLSATDDFMLKELYKMKTMQTRVFVVHMSSSLASRFFPKVKEAGMMSEGYAWIVTSELMYLLYSLDSHVLEAMQEGVVAGAKAAVIATIATAIPT